MGNKNKTISFRVNEDAFAQLRQIAAERELSLSSVFRDYVDLLVAHDGRVQVVPTAELAALQTQDEEGFPPTVSVPKSFIREDERLELETEHLREQLDEHKQFVRYLQDELDAIDEDIIYLEDLDTADGESSYHLG